MLFFNACCATKRFMQKLEDFNNDERQVICFLPSDDSLFVCNIWM